MKKKKKKKEARIVCVWVCLRVVPHASSPRWLFLFVVRDFDWRDDWAARLRQRWALDHCAQQSTQQQHNSHTYAFAGARKGAFVKYTQWFKKKKEFELMKKKRIKRGNVNTRYGGTPSSYCSTKTTVRKIDPFFLFNSFKRMLNVCRKSDRINFGVNNIDGYCCIPFIPFLKGQLRIVMHHDYHSFLRRIFQTCLFNSSLLIFFLF